MERDKQEKTRTDSKGVFFLVVGKDEGDQD